MIRRLVGVALVIAACGGAAAPITTTTAPTVTTATGAPPTTAAGPLATFATIDATVSGSSWTVALADSPALRSQGLMGVSDLGGLDGMLFVFEDVTQVAFTMRDTLIPLDIAFFAADGTLVDLFPMTPCLEEPCPTYAAAAPFRYALEAPAGAFVAIDQPFLELSD